MRDRIPALGLAALLQLAAVWVIIYALVAPVVEKKDAEHETQIVLLPTLPVTAKPKRLRRQTPGSGAITPYFNPYTFALKGLSTPRPQGLSYALSACDVDKYDMASDEIRTVCDRIGALIKHDPGRFGMTSDVINAKHWARELARREAPALAPCMSPGGIMVDLFCVYNFLLNPYDPEKRARYSE